VALVSIRRSQYTIMFTTSYTLNGVLGRGRLGVLKGVQVAGVDRSVHTQ